MRSLRPDSRTVLGTFASLLLAVAFTLGISDALAQEPDWVEVLSPNFQVFSDASGDDARRVAREFEVIRSVFQRALPALVAEPRRPLTILAVRNEDGLLALLPQFRDRGVRPTGAFLEGALEHHIVLRVDSSEYDDFRTIYHEYFHLLTSVNTRRLPTWLMEGLAEVYSNTAVRGDTAEIGNTRLDYLNFLARNRLLPLEALLADDADPHDRDVYGASLFYAQSWALTHLLLLGDGSGIGGALQSYIARMQAGEDPVAGFEAAIAPLEDVQRALAGYIRQDAYYAMRMDAPPNIDEAAFTIRTLSTAEALVARARLLSHAGHPQLARPMLESALADAPNLPEIHEALGLLAWYQNERAEAGAAFADAVRLGSTSYIPYYLGAVIARPASTRVAVDQQVTALRRAIELNPLFAPAYANLATAVYQYPEGRTEALELAQTATELEPNEPASWLALAEVRLAMNRPDEARDAAERGLENARGDEERAFITRFLDSLQGARAHYLRGNALREGGDPAAAAVAYRAALGLDPSSVAAHNGLGLVLRSTGDIEGAVSAFRRVVRLDPENPAGYLNLANSLHARRALDEAIAAYQAAIRLDPDDADTHRVLGDALRDAGEPGAAIEAYQRALELNPADEKARQKLETVRIPSDPT